jgi:hypothetical protein
MPSDVITTTTKYKLEGSKPITKSQNDYFGKGLQVFFPKNNFTCKWNFEWNFL